MTVIRGKVDHMEYREALFKLIEEDIAQRELTSSIDGEMGDRGASWLREKLDIYKAGLGGRVPKEWGEYGIC